MPFKGVGGIVLHFFYIKWFLGKKKGLKVITQEKSLYFNSPQYSWDMLGVSPPQILLLLNVSVFPFPFHIVDRHLVHPVEEPCVKLPVLHTAQQGCSVVQSLQSDHGREADYSSLGEERCQGERGSEMIFSSGAPKS